MSRVEEREKHHLCHVQGFAVLTASVFESSHSGPSFSCSRQAVRRLSAIISFHIPRLNVYLGEESSVVVSARFPVLASISMHALIWSLFLFVALVPLFFICVILLFDCCLFI